MRSAKYISSALCLVLLAGCAAQGTSQTTQAASGSEQAVETSQTSSENSTAEKTKTAGQYISYEDYLDQKDSLGDRIVYYFNASWCPSCRRTNQALLDNLDSIPDGTTIVSVDYDKYTDLRKEYGITMQDTFVELDENGKLKKAFVAPVIDDVWDALSV